MTLLDYLIEKGFTTFEGCCRHEPKQPIDLANLTNKENIKVMEIGFNAGHSAELFLANNKTLTVTSFDLGCHDYVVHGKNYIDMTFPNRHILVIGDSTLAVPKWYEENKDKKFDVIFIDGGHGYDTAKADLENCMKLAHKDTLVIMDDTTYTPGWEREHTIGPTKVWLEYIAANKLIELGKKDYGEGRGMSWGKYNV